MKKLMLLGMIVSFMGLVAGCNTNPPAPAMTYEQAEANRAYVESIQDNDRARDHEERMRQVEAIERINRSAPPINIYR
jgi:outer membrane PBP1 activator LpoA protein